MKLRKFAVIAAMGLCAAGSAWAKDYQAGQVEIDDLWVRASAPGQSNGAGYMEIDNKATAADRLLSVSSSAAERVELHTVETRTAWPRCARSRAASRCPPAARSSWPRAAITSCSSS